MAEIDAHSVEPTREVDVAEGASEMQTTLVELGSHLAEIEQSLEEELQQTADSLENLTDKVQALESQANEILGETRSHYSNLKDQVNQTLEQIQSEAEDLQQGEFENVSTQVQTFEQELTEQIAEALSSVTQFQSTVETVKISFEARKTALIGQFDNFEQKTRSQVQSLVEAFTTFVDASNQQLSEVELQLETNSSDVTERLDRQFIGETVGRLSQSAQQLTQAIDLLSHAGGDVQQQLDGSIGGIVDQIGEVTRLIDDIKPVLDLVKEML